MAGVQVEGGVLGLVAIGNEATEEIDKAVGRVGGHPLEGAGQVGARLLKI